MIWGNGQKIIPFPSVSSAVHCISWQPPKMHFLTPPQKKLVCWNNCRAVLGEEYTFCFLGKYHIWEQSTKGLNPKGFLQALWEEQKVNLGHYIVGENTSMTRHATLLYKEQGTPCSWSQNAEFWSSWVASSWPVGKAALSTSPLICFFHLATLAVLALTIQSKVMCQPLTVNKLPLYKCLLVYDKTDAVLWNRLQSGSSPGPLLIHGHCC